MGSSPVHATKKDSLSPFLLPQGGNTGSPEGTPTEESPYTLQKKGDSTESLFSLKGNLTEILELFKCFTHIF